MELLSLYALPTAHPPPCLSRKPPPSLERSSFFSGQALARNVACSSISRRRNGRGVSFLSVRPRAAGETAASQEAGGNIRGALSTTDKAVAFVAGATGRVGSRTVRELLKLGFNVRAGVRNAQKAETLVQSVKQMKLDDGAQSSEFRPVEKLEIIECNLENQGEIGPAIGDASIVICCIGASEKEIFDVTGPYRIDYQATKNLIDAATVAKVEHFILLTSLGTNKIGFPAALLNLFWGVLLWKRKAEEALIASGVPYTIVRPGGMERPTDTFKETHNIILANEDTYFGGLVSNLQVAELIAFMAKNRSLSFCKVVEVIAKTTAPLRPMGELLLKIPSQRANTTILKPPTTPCPSAPISASASSETATSVSGTSSATPSGGTEASLADPDEKHIKMQTSPLSPYTMYEDLKPPASPTPPLPKY